MTAPHNTHRFIIRLATIVSSVAFVAVAGLGGVSEAKEIGPAPQDRAGVGLGGAGVDQMVSTEGETVAKHVKAASSDKGSGKAVQTKREGAAFSALVKAASVSIPASSDGRVVVSRQGRGAISLGLGSTKPQDGQLASDGSVVYPSKSGVSQSVIPVEDGVRINTVLDSAATPTEFVHNVLAFPRAPDW